MPVNISLIQKRLMKRYIVRKEKNIGDLLRFNRVEMPEEEVEK